MRVLGPTFGLITVQPLDRWKASTKWFSAYTTAQQVQISRVKTSTCCLAITAGVQIQIWPPRWTFHLLCWTEI